MNPRATGLILLAALALGAFVWLYEIEGEAGRKAEADAEKRLFGGFEAEAIDWVELVSSDGTPVRAERSDTGWDIVAPLAFPGDTAAWNAIASALATVTSESAFDEPQAPDVYGLGDGADEIRFGAAGAERALRLGRAAPLGGNTYAAVVGAQPVHTIATWRAAALRKEFDALRDKSVLDFDVGSVTQFEAEWQGARVVLERGGDAWRMTFPVEGPADNGVVNDLLSDLAFLRADGFDDAPAGDVELGLAPPAYRARLTLGAALDDEGAVVDAAPRVLELAVGETVMDGSRHARGAAASLYRIAAARLDDLPREVSAYRYKRLASFDVAAAKRVELVFRGPAGAPVEIVATRDAEGAWNSAPEALDPSKLATLVTELSGLTADQILAERVGPDELAGLELAPPIASFTVHGEPDAAPLAEIRLGAQQGSAGVLAQSGENPQVFRLALELAEQLPINLEALRNHFVASAEPEAGAGAEADPSVTPDIDPELLESLLREAGVE